MLVYPRSTVRIRVVGFALQHDGRLVPTTAWHITRFAATHYLRKVFLTAEKYLDIFMQTTTTVETGIYYYSVTVVVFTQNIRVNSTETTVAHRLNMDISKASVRPFLDIGSTLFYPTFVQQTIELSTSNRHNHFFPTFLILRII